MKKDSNKNFAYQELKYADPLLIAECFAYHEGFMFLHSGTVHPDYGRYSFILFNPLKTFIAYDYSESKHDLCEIQDILKQNRFMSEIGHFMGGVAGYLSYDLGVMLSGEFRTKAYLEINHDTPIKTVLPLYRLGLYNKVISFDQITKKCYASVVKFKLYDYDPVHEIIALVDLYNQAVATSSNFTTTKSSSATLKLSTNLASQNYITKVEQVKNYIKAGDVFEVNLSQKLSAKVPKNYNLWNVYKDICQYNPTQFSSYLNFKDLHIASASPERFLKLKNQHIEARPIKGTIKRSPDHRLDQNNAQILLNSIKDRAENIMIVDLMRNDLSKICNDSSVIVTKLCGLETFPGVHHLVSVVEGSISAQYDHIDAFLACFPGGSITGAPKIRAMEIIEALEPHSRGVYCGNIGYWGVNGISDFSIAIRTIVKYKTELSFCVGGAVTLDSNPQDEYQETLAKGDILANILTGTGISVT